MEDLTGKQFGAYQIISRFKEGGMATIFKAYQASMDRYVALKVLPRFHSADPEFIGRFKQEAKVLAQLQHPHILPIYDFGESDGYTYFVMPLMHVGNLAELLVDERLPVDRIQQIISQVGSALDFAHSRGLIHRDVKPSNILLDETGNCTLMDFGVAKIIEGSMEFTRTGGILGTPVYMSPEQGSGQKIDHKSDIYSLGIILYEMVTGRPPYEAETPVAIIFKHVHDPLPPPSSITPDLSEEIERVILKSLAKNPEDRYETVREMVDALSWAVTASLRKVSHDEDLPPTVREVMPDTDSVIPDLAILEPVVEESQIETIPQRDEAAISRTTTLTENRLFRPAIIVIGAIAMILVGVWLSKSGILSSDEIAEADKTESVVSVSTEIQRGTNTSVAVIEPTIVPVTDTPQSPIPTNTPIPTPVPAYPVVPTAEAPGLGLDIVYFLGFDTSTPPFDNLLVRRAIASSIDRVGLLDTVATFQPDKRIVPATNFTPPGILGFDLYGEVGYPLDTEMARQLLAEAGYPNGEGFPAITLYHRAGESADAYAKQMSEDLNEVLGISVSTSTMEVNYPDTPPFYALGWAADYLDPHNFLYDAFCGSYNRDFLESDQYWSLVGSINVEGNRSARSAMIMEYSNSFCHDAWDPTLDLGQEYKRILDQALEEENYNAARMLYVQAEIILVEENALIVPIFHRSN